MIYRTELLKLVEKMPAFPKSVKRVIELSSDINCSHKELVSVIERDPVMTLKILNLVNSAYFGLSNEITSIKYAVVYVGLNTVKNLAISIASIGMLPSHNDAGLDTEKFLYHTISTATLSRLLAKHSGIEERDSSDYFVGGLLHDFGKIVFALFMPDEYKKVLYLEKKYSRLTVDAEKEIIGVDHTKVGTLLGQKWQLPNRLVEGIKLHHCPNDEDIKENNLLSNIVFISNKLSKEIEENEDIKTFSEELIKDVSARFGNNFDLFIDSPKELLEEVKKSLEFMRP